MFIPIILKQSRNFNASPLSPLFRSKNCPLRQWPIRNFRSKYGTMTEQLASNSLPHVELNNRLLSVPIRCFEIPVSTRGKLETFPTRAHHSIRAEIHLEIRNYRGDLRIPRPIVRPLLVLPPPPPSSIDADVPRRRITRNFRRDRFHGLPETFESLETPKPGGNAPSLATIEAAGRRFPSSKPLVGRKRDDRNAGGIDQDGVKSWEGKFPLITMPRSLAIEAWTRDTD